MFTKGKWIREGTTVEVVQDGEGKMLVDVYGETQEETIANAHLIAAAPELLEACKGAIAALSQHKTFLADIEAAKQMISYAISRAEGKD